MIRPFLYRPVNPFIVTQTFGQNKACIDIATESKYIICDGLNPPAGYKSLYSQMKGHNGLDLVAKRWQVVVASHDGVISDVSTETERGLGVEIMSDDKFFIQELGGMYARIKTRSWHMIALNVHKGDRVKAGQIIGYADSTGYSTGDHCHFELKPVDYHGNNLLQNNGFFGAINPLPYMRQDYSPSFIRTGLNSVSEVLVWISDKLKYI